MFAIINDFLINNSDVINDFDLIYLTNIYTVMAEQRKAEMTRNYTRIANDFKYDLNVAKKAKVINDAGIDKSQNGPLKDIKESHSAFFDDCSDEEGLEQLIEYIKEDSDSHKKAYMKSMRDVHF
jgi:hypothetical protein